MVQATRIMRIIGTRLLITVNELINDGRWNGQNLSLPVEHLRAAYSSSSVPWPWLWVLSNRLSILEPFQMDRP